MSGPDNHKSLCLRVFGIPELAELIYLHCSTRQNFARLLSVCRQFFQDLRLFVWECATEKSLIPLLVPILDTFVPPRDPALPLFKLTQPLITFKLSRFNLYAPFIKTLILPSQTPYQMANKWDDFVARTKTISLLPNLETLHVPSSDLQYVARGMNSVSWVIPFLSTSLLSIQVTCFREHVPTELAHALFQEISQTCPRLESLRLYASHPTTPAREDDLLSKLRRESQSLHEGPSFCPSATLALGSIIPRFYHLRVLETSSFVLEEESFIALSRLPALESLTVRNLSQDHRTYGDNMKLPEHAFPALRYIELGSLSDKTAINLLSEKSLARSLQTVRVDYCRPDDEYELMGDHDFLPRLISVLAMHSPHLTGLTSLEFYGQSVTTRMIKSLSCLPLVTLLLGQVDFSTFDMEALVRALPLLEELRLSSDSCEVHLRQLRMIAISLPRLRRLSLYVNFDSVHGLTGEDFEPPRPQSQKPLCFETNFFPRYVTSVNSSMISRYLHTLWPNINCVAVNRESDFPNYLEGAESSDAGWGDE